MRPPELEQLYICLEWLLHVAEQHTIDNYDEGISFLYAASCASIAQLRKELEDERVRSVLVS